MLHDLVFLVDVDNTLLDNDAVIADLREHLVQVVGTECERRYWEIFEQIRIELGYADYLGALQRYRIERPREIAHGVIEVAEQPFVEVVGHRSGSSRRGTTQRVASGPRPSNEEGGPWARPLGTFVVARMVRS